MDVGETFSDLLCRLGGGGHGCLLTALLMRSENLKRGPSVVSAAIDGVERLPAESIDDEAVVAALADVCRAAELTGATIYAAPSADVPAGDAPACRLAAAYRWGSAVRRAGADGLPLAQFGRWLDCFARAQPIAANLADLPPDEQAALAPLGIRAVAAVPVLREGKLDSLIVFEDVQGERDWSGEQVDGLTHAGRLLVASLRLWGAPESAAGQATLQRALADVSTLAVRAIGPDCRMRYWNRACEALYGYSAADAVGRDAVDLTVPAETRDVARRAISEGFATGRVPMGRECRAVDAGGAELWLVSASHVVRSPGGDEMYLMDVDVTDIKRRCDEEVRLQRQLHGARKMETIGHLIGGVAHHFNNALTVIQGNSELIHKIHAADQELRELVEQILLATMVSSQLTSQLLSYSRMGRRDKAQVDVHELVRSVVEKLVAEMEPRPRIATDLRAAPHTVEADETQLRSALTNLGINACEATAAGGEVLFATQIVELDEALCASAPREISPGRFLRVTVGDTGVGMDSQTLQRAMEPLFTTKPFGQGHGLGLAGVYGCAMSHNGMVDVASELGKGSTVQLFLPLTQKDLVTPGHGPLGAPVSRGSVMVVDNEGSARQTLAGMLSAAGYQVLPFANGADAIEYYRSRAEGIDLAVVEMNMPDLNGRETFGRLKEINPDLRGLLSGGLLKASDAQAILDAGVKGFLSKPYRAGETMQRIATAMGG